MDAADFQNWYDHRLESTYSATRGDFNFDGIADGRDFDLWYTAAGPNAQPTLDALGLDHQTLSGVRGVPEPTTLALLGLGAIALLRARKAKRQAEKT